MKVSRVVRLLLVVVSLLGTIPRSPQVHAAGTLYSVTDLGDLGFGYSLALALSNTGAVVGYAGTSPCCTTAPFLWRHRSLVSLGTLGGDFGQANAVNDFSQSVGWSYSTSGVRHAFLASPHIAITALGDLGGGSSQAFGINDLQQIVGGANYANSTWYRAVLWQGGRLQDLGTFGGPAAQALGLNNRGQVVGVANDAANVAHAFLWQRGRMSPLAPAGDRGSAAVAINDIGEAVGYGYQSVPSDSHAVLFLWGREVNLGTVDGDSESQANAINNEGMVVGGSGIINHPFHAFVWRGGTITDLNTLIPPGSGWYLIDATGINDFGQISGYGLYNGNLQSFVLTPTWAGRWMRTTATAPTAGGVQAAVATLPASQSALVGWNRPSLSVGQ